MAEQFGEAAAGWVTLDPADPETLNFTYPEAVGVVLPYIRPVVRIDMGGRSDVWPTEDVTITPYAAEAPPRAFEAATVAWR